MSTQREVWISHEGTITLWEEDGSGGYVNPAKREEIYCQSLQCDAVIDMKRRGQPGVATHDVRTIILGYTIKMRAWYERKDQQQTPFLDNTKKFRVKFALVNPKYDGVTAGQENDTDIYRDCSVAAFSKVSEDDKLIEVSLTFEAERKE